MQRPQEFRVHDFFADYPEVVESKADVLTLHRKDEFYNAWQVSDAERLPGETEDDAYAAAAKSASRKFGPKTHQLLVSRLLSSRTPIESVLLFHEMGVGKTCAAVLTAESVMDSVPNSKTLLLVKSNIIKQMWLSEIVNVCAAHRYQEEPSTASSTTLAQRDRRRSSVRVRRLVESRYVVKTYDSFFNEHRPIDNHFNWDHVANWLRVQNLDSTVALLEKNLPVYVHAAALSVKHGLVEDRLADFVQQISLFRSGVAPGVKRTARKVLVDGYGLDKEDVEYVRRDVMPFYRDYPVGRVLKMLRPALYEEYRAMYDRLLELDPDHGGFLQYMRVHWASHVVIADEVHNIIPHQRKKHKTKTEERQELGGGGGGGGIGFQGQRQKMPKTTLTNQYNFYLMFFQAIYGSASSKRLFLTGTPMVDKVNEIVDLMNVVVPLQPLPPLETEATERLDTFARLEERRKQWTKLIANPATADYEKLAAEFVGHLSYTKSSAADSQVQVQMVGDPATLEGRINLHKTWATRGGIQQRSYRELLRAAQLQGAGGASSISNQSLQEASLFVFPNGSVGRTGLETYLCRHSSAEVPTGPSPFASLAVCSSSTTTSADPQFERRVQVKTEHAAEFARLYSPGGALRAHSTKYHFVLDKAAIHLDRNTVVYFELVHGSGAALFTAILELWGYHRYSSADGTTKGKRYGVLIHEWNHQELEQSTQRAFNSPENVHGEVIQIMVLTPAYREAITLKNVQTVHIMTPSTRWNYPSIDQAIKRSVRMNSHRDLLREVDSVTVSVYLHAFVPRWVAGDADGAGVRGGVVGAGLLGHVANSIDMHIYNESERKDSDLKAMEYVLKQWALDCSWLRRNNISTNPSDDFTRRCDYQPCSYDCMLVHSSDINVPFDLIDRTTSHLFSSRDEQDTIVHQLRTALQHYRFVDLRPLLASICSRSPMTTMRAVQSLLGSWVQNFAGTFGTVVYSHYCLYLSNPLTSSPLDSFYYEGRILLSDNQPSFDSLVDSLRTAAAHEGIESHLTEASGPFELFKSVESAPLDMVQQLVERNVVAVLVEGNQELAGILGLLKLTFNMYVFSTDDPKHGETWYSTIMKYKSEGGGHIRRIRISAARSSLSEGGSSWENVPGDQELQVLRLVENAQDRLYELYGVRYVGIMYYKAGGGGRQFKIVDHDDNRKRIVEARQKVLASMEVVPKDFVPVIDRRKLQPGRNCVTSIHKKLLIRFVGFGTLELLQADSDPTRWHSQVVDAFWSFVTRTLTDLHNRKDAGGLSAKESARLGEMMALQQVVDSLSDDPQLAIHKVVVDGDLPSLHIPIPGISGSGARGSRGARGGGARGARGARAGGGRTSVASSKVKKKYHASVEGGSGHGGTVLVYRDQDGQILQVEVLDGGSGYVAGDRVYVSGADIGGGLKRGDGLLFLIVQSVSPRLLAESLGELTSASKINPITEEELAYARPFDGLVDWGRRILAMGYFARRKSADSTDMSTEYICSWLQANYFIPNHKMVFLLHDTHLIKPFQAGARAKK